LWINKSFPGLKETGYYLSSEADDQYNCIAWAASIDSEFWSPLPGYRWPGERTLLVESLVSLFADLGYVLCESDSREEGYEKIAIYAQRGVWKHAARQLSDGKWTSKLGPDEDIVHVELDGLDGPLYGSVHSIMRRPV
jgi:hypothetical protein